MSARHEVLALSGPRASLSGMQDVVADVTSSHDLEKPMEPAGGADGRGGAFNLLTAPPAAGLAFLSHKIRPLESTFLRFVYSRSVAKRNGLIE